MTEKDANYWVNIDSVVEQKLDAAMAHVSQWEPSINHYRPDWDKADLEKTKAELKRHILKKDGHYVEAFRTTNRIQSGMRLPSAGCFLAAFLCASSWCGAADLAGGGNSPTLRGFWK